MNRASLAIHLGRIRHQLGAEFKLGSASYRVRGYCANRLPIGLGHEQHVYRAIERVLATREGTFVDVGVNVGQTLFTVLSIDPSRSYVGFEPQIDCSFFVDQFIRDNGLDHLQVIAMALSDTDGFLPLYSNRDCDDMASLQGDTEVDGQQRRMSSIVAVRRGDAAISELGIEAIAAIKIDVEGAELQVLRGLTETLGKYRPPVLFELLPNYYGHERIMQPSEVRASNNEAASGILELLTGAGYRISQIDPQGEEREIERFDLDTPDQFVSSDYIAHSIA